MIVSKTPLRISFAGGGTDLPSFYKTNEYGAVFSSSINKYIYISVKSHCHLYPEKIRLNYSETEQVNDIDDIQNPIIRECLKFLNINENIYISTVSDAPASSGLGSSSSFCVGLLNALYTYKNITVSKEKLAEEASHIEIEILKRPIGKQDHYAATFGGLNYFKFLSNGNVEKYNVSDENLIVEKLFSNLFTFWTGIQRDSTSVLSEQNKNAALNNETLKMMRNQAMELYDFTTNNNYSLYDIGSILHKGWVFKQKLASNITNVLIKSAYEKAIGSGAIGGKLSGAGAGGFLSLIVPSDCRNNVLNEMKKMKLTYFPIGIESMGTSIISNSEI